MAEFDTAILELTIDRGAGDELLRVSTRAVKGAADVLPRLAGAPEYNVEPGLWIWGSRNRSGVGDVEIINADAKLDWITDAVYRDKPARLLVGRKGQVFGDFEVAAELTTDHIATTRDRRLRVVFAAPDVVLSETLQQLYYLDGVPNERLEGQPVPLTIGRVTQAPGLLYDGDVNIDYDVHITMPALIDLVASNGNPALSSQWSYRDRGFRMSITPAGRVTADLAARQIQSGHTSSDLVGYPSSGHINQSENSDFTSWKGADPDGYTLANHDVASPEKTIARYLTTNSLRIANFDQSFGGAQVNAPRLARNLGLIPGLWYGIRLDLVAVSGWTNQIQRLFVNTDEAAGITDNGGDLVYDSGGPISGDQLFYFKATGPVLKLIFGGGLVTGNNTEIRLNSMRLWRVQTPEVDLADLVPWVLEMSGWTGAVDTAGLAALSAEIGPHELGDYITDTINGETALERLLGAFLAFHYVDAAGEIKFARLQDPEDIPGDPVLEITPEMVLRGQKITVEDDLLPGFTDIYGGKRNQLPIPRESSAGAVSSLSAAEDVAAEFRIIARGSPEDLDPFYAWAHNRCIFDCRLQDRTSIERERARTAAIASKRRQWIRIPAILNRHVALEPGQKIRVTWPGYGLEAGVDAVLINYSRAYLGGRIDLLAWR